MRKGGTTLDQVPVDAPHGDAPRSGDGATPGADPAARRHRWRSRLRTGGIAAGSVIAVVLVVSVVLLAQDLRATSKRALGRQDVADMVGKAIKQTVEDLQSAPPPAVEIYNA